MTNLALGRSLEQIQVDLIRMVDDQAEEVRGRFITLGAGMALIYEQKLRESEVIMASTTFNENGEPVTAVQLGEVPTMAVEAVDLGTHLYGAAMTVIITGHQWAPIGAVIESRRLSAKRAIRAANTPAAARAAAVVDWSDLYP